MGINLIVVVPYGYNFDVFIISFLKLYFSFMSECALASFH